MTVDIEDTIAAIATANGVGQRGIVRLTGPNTVPCVHELFELDVCLESPTQSPVKLQLDEELYLDGQLLLWPTERSYTRQPSAEFHTLGSTPLLELALEKICAVGCRIARPGEFTLRAFLGGRLDLTQAEAVLAVIDSTEEKHFDVALQQLAGGLANPLSRIRNQLIDLLAELEVGLDFVEEDIEFVSSEEVVNSVTQCIESVESIRKQIGSRETREVVYDVVLVGCPNVGKSSLFNAMLDQERSIVADVAGTTRDYVSATVDRGGLQIQLIDTAGVDTVSADAEGFSKGSPDLQIDSAAQLASHRQLEAANLKLLCLDSNRRLNETETRLLDMGETDSTLVVLTKCDLERQIRFEGEYCLTSSLLGKNAGIDGLWDAVCDRVAMTNFGDSGVVGSTLSRCREHLGEVYRGLVAGKEAAQFGAGDEIVAAELRHALEQLGRIVGAVYTDDILDRIFGRFCIGK